jgi:ATP dependent DNA ligase C terminal region
MMMAGFHSIYCSITGQRRALCSSMRSTFSCIADEVFSEYHYQAAGPQVRRKVYRKFKGLEIATCPFTNLPEKKRTMWALTKEEMRNCQWLKPELVAQIEFAEWTPDGHLRHSKFVGLREDKDTWTVRRE